MCFLRCSTRGHDLTAAEHRAWYTRLPADDRGNGSADRRPGHRGPQPELRPEDLLTSRGGDISADIGWRANPRLVLPIRLRAVPWLPGNGNASGRNKTSRQAVCGPA